MSVEIVRRGAGKKYPGAKFKRVAVAGHDASDSVFIGGTGTSDV